MNASVGTGLTCCVLLFAIATLGVGIATLVSVHDITDDDDGGAGAVATGNLRTQSVEDAAVQSTFEEFSLFATDLTAFDAAQAAPAHPGPLRVARAMAIVNIAMADVVAATTRSFEPFTDLAFVEPGAAVSQSAAIVAAAHDTMVALYPAFKQRIDSVTSKRLSAIANTQAKQRGIELGREAARLILALRANDGANHAEPPAAQFESSEVGRWRRDPVAKHGVAMGGLWAEKVAPFVIDSAQQFRVPPPAPLDSELFAMEYNEVKSVGGDGVDTKTVRDDWGTMVGLFWAYDGTGNVCAPPRLYIQLAFAAANQNGVTMVNAVRMIATLSIAMADTGLAAWESKYFYLRARPVTMIRDDGDKDNNPLTQADPTWTPLGAPASNSLGPNFTPPFPAYPSGHATFGGALAHLLRQFIGRDQFEVVFTSSEFDGVTRDNAGKIRPQVTRTFSSATQIEFENGDSRPKLGIHWRMDCTNGIAQGQAVAKFVADRVFPLLARGA